MPKQPDTTPTTVGDNDCAICFSELTGSVIQTECAHKFHLACLSQWLTGPDATATPSCPLCRSPLKETTAVLAGIAATATAATAAPAASPTPTPTPTPTPVPIANAIANANVNALASLSRPPPRQQRSQRRAMNRVPNRALLSNQLGTPHSRSYARTDIRVPAEDPLPPAKEAPEEVSTAPATSTAGDTAPLPADGDAGEGAMAMRFTTEFSALAAAVETDLYSMLTIKAPASNTVDVDNVDDDDLDDVVEDARLPMDLVVVCDKSGSMQGEKMELLRQTVSFVAEELEARDRLCVVAFNGSAEFMCGLECMTETGKGRMAANIVSSPLMRAGGGTDIGAGLTYGLEALRRREETNAITSVLLLSDGQDSRTASNIGSILADNPAGSVHVFGLGADHDAVTLAAIAEAGNGTFSYIEDAELIGDSFSAVLGGLSSTVAARVAVEIVVPEGSSIVSLKTHYTSSVSADRRTATVNIPDLYEEEEKDIVFVWHAAAAADGPGSSTTLAAHLEWSTPGSAETAARSTLDTTGDLPRPAAVEPHDLVANIGLDAQRNRVVAAEALEAAMAAADAGDLETARAVIDAAIETLTTSVSADMEQVAALRADLEESKTRMASRQVYSRGGHAYMASNMQGHKKQRAAVQSNIDDRAGAYAMNKRQKLKMRKMKKASAMKAMH